MRPGKQAKKKTRKNETMTPRERRLVRAGVRLAVAKRTEVFDAELRRAYAREEGMRKAAAQSLADDIETRRAHRVREDHLRAQITEMQLTRHRLLCAHGPRRRRPVTINGNQATRMFCVACGEICEEDEAT